MSGMKRVVFLGELVWCGRMVFEGRLCRCSGCWEDYAVGLEEGVVAEEL